MTLEVTAEAEDGGGRFELRMQPVSSCEGKTFEKRERAEEREEQGPLVLEPQ